MEKLFYLPLRGWWLLETFASAAVCVFFGLLLIALDDKKDGEND